jgi:hypothetical protein
MTEGERARCGLRLRSLGRTPTDHTFTKSIGGVGLGKCAFHDPLVHCPESYALHRVDQSRVRFVRRHGRAQNRRGAAAREDVSTARDASVMHRGASEGVSSSLVIHEIPY